ncbi:unnamed protein product [Boreogadus saida]
MGGGVIGGPRCWGHWGPQVLGSLGAPGVGVIGGPRCWGHWGPQVLGSLGAPGVGVIGGPRCWGHWGTQGVTPDPDLLLLTSDLRLLDEGWVLNGEQGSFGQGGHAPPAVAPPLQLSLRPSSSGAAPPAVAPPPPAVAPPLQLWLRPSSCGSPLPSCGAAPPDMAPPPPSCHDGLQSGDGPTPTPPHSPAPALVPRRVSVSGPITGLAAASPRREVVGLNKTKTRNSLALDGTLSSIMTIKMADLEPCFKWEPPSDVLKASKKATGQYNRAHRS